jgi:surface antigen
MASFGLLCAATVLGSGPAGAEAQTLSTCQEPALTHYRVSNESPAALVSYNDVSQVRTANAGSSYTLPATCGLRKVGHNYVLLSNLHFVYIDMLDLHIHRAVLIAHERRASQPARKRLVSIRRNVVLQYAVRFNFAGARNAAVGQRNPFPYGQCTWWADQRYYQLHGVFVPWQTNANAWQWTTRAVQFGWRVSTAPQVGDIMVLQPGVQGAFGLGHVAVVEKVLSGERVIASSMNWGDNRGSVTDALFHAGPGVAFISG